MAARHAATSANADGKGGPCRYVGDDVVGAADADARGVAERGAVATRRTTHGAASLAAQAQQAGPTVALRWGVALMTALALVWRLEAETAAGDEGEGDGDGGDDGVWGETGGADACAE